VSAVAPHLAALQEALLRFDAQAARIEECGAELASVVLTGGRLLCCGNGGSAEQAQHLTAEFVCRYEGDRPGRARPGRRLRA
jgi:D-sedoheptulose 7-phosphate isomerase